MIVQPNPTMILPPSLSTRRVRLRALRYAALLWLSLHGQLVGEDELAVTPLPPPQRSGGKPLLDALRERQSRREFKPDALTETQLSTLLWAAFGVNRPENGHRTAPSAMNTQDVEIYVATADGLYHYEAALHHLTRVLERDLRSLTSTQDTVKAAPIQLIYVSDWARMSQVSPRQRELYSGIDVGCIVQNVYLFGASAGLAVVVHELDREALAKVMGLRAEQHIVIAQAVGLPR